MKLTPKVVAAILSAVVLIAGAISTALAALPANDSAVAIVLTVLGAIIGGALPLIHDAHANKIVQLLGGIVSEALAAQQPAPTVTPDPAPVDPAPVTPVTPVVDVAAVVAQFQAKQAEAAAILAQLTAGQSA